jgi:hypothetical protein
MTEITRSTCWDQGIEPNDWVAYAIWNEPHKTIHIDEFRNPNLISKRQQPPPGGWTTKNEGK